MLVYFLEIWKRKRIFDIGCGIYNYSRRNGFRRNFGGSFIDFFAKTVDFLQEFMFFCRIKLSELFSGNT